MKIFDKFESFFLFCFFNLKGLSKVVKCFKMFSKVVKSCQNPPRLAVLPAPAASGSTGLTPTRGGHTDSPASPLVAAATRHAGLTGLQPTGLSRYRPTAYTGPQPTPASTASVDTGLRTTQANRLHRPQKIPAYSLHRPTVWPHQPAAWHQVM